MAYAKPRRGEIGGGDRWQCYFDVHSGSKVQRDFKGVEADDLSEVVDQARIAIDEYWDENRPNAVSDAGALLLVRVQDQSAVFVLALDRSRAPTDFRS